MWKLWKSVFYVLIGNILQIFDDALKQYDKMCWFYSYVDCKWNCDFPKKKIEIRNNIQTFKTEIRLIWSGQKFNKT